MNNYLLWFNVIFLPVLIFFYVNQNTYVTYVYGSNVYKRYVILAVYFLFLILSIYFIANPSKEPGTFLRTQMVINTGISLLNLLG